MGWTFFHDTPSKTRADIIRREFECSPTETHPVAYGFEMIAERGATVYAIMYRENVAEQTPRIYFGMVFLTQRKRGEFGYKEIGEECGPNECAMPIGMLNRLEQLAPDADGYAAKWRAAVRAHHARKREKARTKWAPGQCVKFSQNGDVFRLIEKAAPRRGWRVVRVADGAYMRAPANRFANAQLVTP